MKYIAPGAKVRIDTGSPGDGVYGVVDSVEIDRRGVNRYLITYWSAGVRFCEWIDPEEIEEDAP